MYTGVNGETLLHYKGNFGEMIQVHKQVVLGELEASDNAPKFEPEKEKKRKVEEEELEDAKSLIYRIRDLIIVKDAD